MTDGWSISLSIQTYPACTHCKDGDKHGQLVPLVWAGRLSWQCTKCNFKLQPQER
jgi:hypothetical protein